MPLPSLDVVLDRFPFQVYSVGEVAKMIDKSPSTVRRWRQDGEVVPTVVLYQGSLRIPLYTDEDVERARGFAATVRRGPKPKNHPLRVASGS